MKNEIIKNIIYSLDCKSPTAYDGIELSKEESNLLLDYITNLQEENKNLKQINEEHRNLNGELRKENKGLKGAIETIKETNKLLIQQKAQLQDDLDMLDKRNEKAIELIYKTMKETDITGNGTLNLNELLDVLQGSDEK